MLSNDPTYRQHFPVIFFGQGRVGATDGSSHSSRLLSLTSSDAGSSSRPGSGSGSNSAMGADNAMVKMMQQLGLIAATLVHGQEQQAQAMAQQAQVLQQMPRFRAAIHGSCG